MKIEQWPITRLLPYARNPRTHSKAQIAQIAASIAEFGFINPILAGSDGVIAAGHGRLAAAQKLGLETVPVIVLDHLTPAQRRALVIADNRISENAGWDFEILAVELDELRDMGFDLPLLGFDRQTLNDLIGTANAGPPPGALDTDTEEDEMLTGKAPAMPVPVLIELTRDQYRKWKAMCKDMGDLDHTAGFLRITGIDRENGHS